MDSQLASHAVRRPRARRGLATTTAGRSLLIEGGPSRQVLNGAAALALIPRMLAALDGQRSREQLCAELELSDPQLDQAIRLLDECGLLEWVQPGDAAEFAADHVAAYMSRTVTVSDTCRSSDDLARALAASTVLLVGPAPVAEPIADDLRETGVGEVTIMTAAQVVRAMAGQALAGPAAAVGAGRLAVAVFDAPAQAAALNLVAAAGLRDGVPVVRFAETGDYAEAGPTFCGASTACIECFRRSQSEEADPDQLTGLTGLTGPTALTGLLSGMVTLALISILTSQPPAAPLKRLTRVLLSSLRTESYDVVPDLECAHCAGGTPPASQAARDLLAYEWQSARVTPALEQADAATPARRGRISALQRDRDGFLTSPRHPLPDQVGTRQLNRDLAGQGPAGSIGEPLLAEIFARVAGFRPAAAGSADRSSRWAPSGGNLASVALYLITDLDLFGLPGTIFRYDDLEHQVLSVRADRVPVSQLLDGTSLDAAGTDAVLVLVGEVGRLRRKYGDFAWRLAHLDAGCAALQLQLVTQRHDVRATFASAWPARTADLLDLDKHDEVITAIAALAVAAQPRTEDSASCP